MTGRSDRPGVTAGGVVVLLGVGLGVLCGLCLFASCVLVAMGV